MSRDNWYNRKAWFWSQNESGQRITEFCQHKALVLENSFFQQHKWWLYTWTSPDGQHRNQIDHIIAAEEGEVLYSQQKQDWELTVAQIMKSLQNWDLNWRKYGKSLDHPCMMYIKPYSYTVEVKNRFKGLDLKDRVPEKLWWRFVTLYRRQISRPSSRKRIVKRQSGYLRKPYKKLRKEKKRKAMEKRKDKPIWMQSSKE